MVKNKGGVNSLAWLAALAWLLALLAPLAAVAAGQDATPPSPLHLAQAEMLRTASDAPTPAPQAVASASLGGAWQAIALPHGPGAQLLRQAGYALGTELSPGPAPAGSVVTSWYRIAVPPFTPPATALNVYFPRIKVYGTIAVYVDGKLLEQRQLEGPTWYWSPLLLALDGAPARAPREILLRLQHRRSTDTAVSSMWLGSADAVGWRYQGRQWLQFYLPVMGAGAFLAVGLFSLFVWIKRGSGAGYGLFALLSMVQSVRALSYFSDIEMGNAWFSWLMLNSLFWSIMIVHTFQVFCHGRPQRWLRLSLFTVAFVVGAASLPDLTTWFDTPEVRPLVYLLAIAAGVAVSVAGVWAAWGRSAEALLITSGVVMSVLFGVNDWALQSNFVSVEGWYLGPYTNLQNFIMLCYLMYRRYARAQAQVERSALELARCLATLEAKLAASYGRVRQFEYQHTVAEERQRLMQEMHDGLGSSLHSALRAIERRHLDAPAVADILRACIDDLHLTIDALEPVEADLLLLLATLRYRMGARLHDAGIALRWEVVDVAPLDWIDPAAALHILRILQEALTNIVKHTTATSITVSTASVADERGEGVRIVVADNGGGFDLAPALRRGGNGLANQQRRARAIGGRIDWEIVVDAAQRGTRVLLWLPTLRPAPSPRIF